MVNRAAGDMLLSLLPAMISVGRLTLRRALGLLSAHLLASDPMAVFVGGFALVLSLPDSPLAGCYDVLWCPVMLLWLAGAYPLMHMWLPLL